MGVLATKMARKTLTTANYVLPADCAAFMIETCLEEKGNITRKLLRLSKKLGQTSQQLINTLYTPPI